MENLKNLAALKLSILKTIDRMWYNKIEEIRITMIKIEGQIIKIRATAITMEAMEVMEEMGMVMKMILAI